jgi:hypothetical protein
MAVGEITQKQQDQTKAAVTGTVAAGVTFAGATVATTDVLQHMEGDKKFWEAISQTAGDYISKSGEILTDLGTAVKENAQKVTSTINKVSEKVKTTSPEQAVSAATPENMEAAQQAFSGIKEKAADTLKAIREHAGELGEKFHNLDKKAQAAIIAGTVIVATVVTAVSLGADQDKHTPQIDTAKTEIASKSTHAHTKSRETSELNFG